ncbi:NADH-quinone oxidoreductase subunit B family protein [Geobacter pickeringii]|uniref:Hydrogenase n=1 Tax=Geobacter pickeringii TaxID=345632 RepID=A0A0B5BC57_9BACT|nr:hydrogenase [Geobacter pickeringii]AJE02624.1 hydrogenase [Geobacter pickeringii]
MLRAIIARLKQGHRTMAYPKEPVHLPERFRGYPEFTPGAERAGGDACAAACPHGAISCDGGIVLDMGRCLFCPECTAGEFVRFTTDHRLAATRREQLVVRPGGERHLAHPLEPGLRSLIGRSLKFREVSAGGCNACEADTNVLSTIGWDLGRFGIQFVASPRHADGLWVTGPVTENMREALLMTWEAIPGPKIVVACGACAIGGGPFAGSPEAHDGVDGILPVDLYIPGCPPHPAAILDGLLRLIGRIEGE